jgi:transposase
MPLSSPVPSRLGVRGARHRVSHAVRRTDTMIKRRLPNILTYIKHQITNATSEGLNSKIQWIRYTARGFRNRENFKTAIYFHCGRLDLYPLPTHTKAG